MGSSFSAVTLLCEFLNLVSGTIATIVAGIIIAVVGIIMAIGPSAADKKLSIYSASLRILMGIGIAIGIINLGPMIGLNFAADCGGSLGVTLNLNG